MNYDNSNLFWFYQCIQKSDLHSILFIKISVDHSIKQNSLSLEFINHYQVQVVQREIKRLRIPITRELTCDQNMDEIEKRRNGDEQSRPNTITLIRIPIRLTDICLSFIPSLYAIFPISPCLCLFAFASCN